jgi:hypothetical protein
MADIEFRRKHPFGQADALGKLQAMMDNFQASKPDLVKTLDWSGNTATASGKYFKGTFTVDEHELAVELNLIGFAAKMAKRMVRDQIGKTLDEEFPA